MSSFKIKVYLDNKINLELTFDHGHLTFISKKKKIVFKVWTKN